MVVVASVLDTAPGWPQLLHRNMQCLWGLYCIHRSQSVAPTRPIPSTMPPLNPAHPSPSCRQVEPVAECKESRFEVFKKAQAEFLAHSETGGVSASGACSSWRFCPLLQQQTLLLHRDSS